MNVGDVLRSTPATVRRIEGEVWTEKEKLSRMKVRERFMESDAFMDVSALEIGGKKVYGNESARESASRLKLKNDPAYQALQAEMREQELLISRMMHTLDYHRDIQRNARILALASVRTPLDIVLDDLEAA